MAITLNGTSGISTPGLTNTGTGTLVGLTTTGNTILGDASTDTLNVGNGDLVKDASGNVGIGTSSPSGKTHIYTTAAVGAVNQASSALNIENTPGDPMMILTGASGGIIASMTSAQAATPMRFYTGTAERMRIDSSGNVGIGVTPSTILHVKSAAPIFRLETTGTVTTGGAAYNTIADSTSSTVWVNGFAGLANCYQFATNFTNGFMRFMTGVQVEAMRIDSAGRLYINQSGQLGNTLQRVGIQYAANTEWGLNITNSTTSTGNAVNFTNSSGTQVGQIQCSTSVTSYVTSSDQRLKANIVDAPSALDSVNAIKVRSFDWKSDSSHVDYGYIAQELLEVAPEAVSVPSDEDEMMGVDFGKLTPRLVKAIQELKAIIDTQNDTINNLTTRLETLEGAV